MFNFCKKAQLMHRTKIWYIFLACRFNMVGFSNKTESWQIGLMEPSEENCHDAVRWAAGLKAHGNTCTLEALQVRIKFYN